MKRDLDRLGQERFDLLVVGLGIHGAALARAAALRGYAVAAIEAGDFGGGVSANSQKVIHGGLRYLQHLDLGRLRESVAARRRLLRLAPHLVAPLGFVVPTRGWGLNGPGAMGAALLLYALLSADRNRGLPPERRLPPARLLGRRRLAALHPYLAEPATGGALWYDALARDTERLTLAFVQAAAEAGAAVANYLRATGLLRGGRRVEGVQAVDLEGGREYCVRARCTVLAAGPQTPALWSQLGGAAPGLRWARALNVVVRRPIAGRYALGFPARTTGDRDGVPGQGRRLYFCVPWGDANIVGTEYQPVASADGAWRAGPAEVGAFLEAFNASARGVALAASDVLQVHQGLLPLADGTDPRSLTLHTRPLLWDARHGPGMEGLLALIGVKFTTATEAADRVLGRLRDRLGAPRRPAAGGREPPLPGGEAWRAAPPEGEMARVLWARYGCRYRQVLETLRGAPEGGTPVAEGLSLYAGEVRHVVRVEMARRLTDVVARRTGVGAAGHPGPRVLERCARIMGAELGWDEGRRAREVAEAEAWFRAANPLAPPPRRDNNADMQSREGT